jgi:hypothetical protein
MKSLSDLVEERGNRRLSAYYYGFDPTDVEEIDLILAAVATAGKLTHHTEWWNDVIDYYGESPVGFIQRMAEQAAEQVKSLKEEAEKWKQIHCRGCECWDEREVNA